LDGDLDALPGDGIGKRHVDLAGRQLELPDLVTERDHEDATAANDLDGPLPAGTAITRPRDDQGLVRRSDLVAAAYERDEKDDDDDDQEDRQHGAADEIEDVRHGRSPLL
jgi:hypothetical protein